MSTTPDEMRAAKLRSKLAKSLRNISGWWGITPDLAATVLGSLRDELSGQGRIGAEQWPDPRCARYAPGMADADLRALAYRGALALAAQGERPSGRRLWQWCRANGARKRETDAVRIIRGVLSSLSAAEAGAAYVCRDGASFCVKSPPSLSTIVD